MSRVRWIMVGLLVPVSFGCDAREATWAGTIVDSAGTTIVTNPMQGLWSEGDRWNVREVLRLGTSPDDAEQQFGSIGSLAVASDGTIHVLDALSLEVRSYSAAGQYLRSIGRPGQGPGEFGRGVSSIVLTDGDTLLVPDLLNRQVHRFAPDGSYVGGLQLQPDRQGTPLRWRATSSGRVAAQVLGLDWSQGPPPRPDSMSAIVAFDAEWRGSDTLVTFRGSQTYTIGRTGAPEVTVFAPVPLWDVSNDLRVALARSDVYRIHVTSRDGISDLVIRKMAEPEVVTAGDQRLIRGFLERTWREAGWQPAPLTQRMSTMTFAETFPTLVNLAFGPEGTIWVQLAESSATLEEWLETSRADPLTALVEDRGAPGWDVFAADGRFLGSVVLPRHFKPIVVQGWQLYGVDRNELDVESVLVLEVVKPSD